MKCSKCGKEIANDSVFCEYCGTEIKKGNTNKKENPKRVDIRWALLPAMLIATFAMWIRWADIKADDRDDFELLGLLAMIPSTILFFISLWNRIKNKIATSFVLIMSVLLLLNCAMLNDLFDSLYDEGSDCYYLHREFGESVWGIASVLLVCYLIYVFVAHKKNWNF